eukprot:5510239-Amphidinium_carterae.1
MQLRFIDGLPTPRERVGNLGGLSRDTTATLPVVGLRWVFTTAVREEQGVSGSSRSWLNHRGQFLRKLDSKPK